MKLAVRLRTFVTVAFIAAALVPTISVAFLYYWQGLGEKAAAADQAGRHATLAADLVERALEPPRETFLTLLGSVDRTPEVSEGLLADLLTDPSYSRHVQALVVLDAHGTVLAAQSAAASHPFAWRPPQGEQPELLVAPGQHGPPALAFAASLPHQPGLYLVGEVNTRPVTLLLQEYAAANNLLLQLDGAAPGGPPFAPAGGYATASAKVGQSGLVIWSQLPLQTGTLHLLWLVLAMGTLGVTLATLFGRFVAGQLGRPLAAVMAASDLLARGEHEARVGPVPATAPVELRELVGHVNHLAERLSDTQTALVHANQDLENRVAQRTEELARRNVDLGYSRATLYAVMESMNAGVVLVTPDRRIRYINRNTEALVNLKEPFYPGRSAEQLYDAVAQACEDPSGTREQLDRSIADPTFSPVLTVTPEGLASRYLRWRTFPIQNPTGAGLGVGHILMDVTQEHEVDRVKSELISTVSHELRTPLTAIRASISSLLRPHVQWDEETRSDFLVTISEESRHLQELIESWLDMSKIEAGILRLDLHPARVEQLVDRVTSRARMLYPDWQFPVHLSPALGTVSVDAHRIEQVLLNLVDNAVKYGAENRTVTLGAEQRGQEVLLKVRDRGIGIPPEHLPLIFERFHRVDSRLTRDTGGWGLGLAICRGIVEAHGGRIWAESELGKGSTFYVALPAAMEEEGNRDEAIDPRR